ncbi:MAG: ATP-independent RNA helicase DbpA [Gammaproteobacteria bacterium]
MNATRFAVLKLSSDLLSNLEALEYREMTPVQAQTLPHILAGEDVIGQGVTGSGKTAAFGLGLLERINRKMFRPQALVICPTRELADQVAKEIRKLARTIPNVKVTVLCGGVPFGPQVGALAHGTHIVVGTPGRIEEHLTKSTLVLRDVSMLVLDEADRMLDMGFQPAIDAIVKHVPDRRQTLLFSATFAPETQSIAKRIMTKPVTVHSAQGETKPDIEEHFYSVSDKQERRLGLRLLLMHFKPVSALVFCNTKRETDEVTEELRSYGFSALALHGDLEQRERDQTLVQFSNKSVSVLVATDVAARGLDIDALDAVINYEIAHDPEIHLHRIGRTGRAGSRGVACSLFSDAERHKVALLEGDVDPILDHEPLPSPSVLQAEVMQPAMATLHIDAGKKQKIRPGDILGALTGDDGVLGADVGKIAIFDNMAFVAVRQEVARVASRKLGRGKMKGRSVRARLIRD